MIPSIGRIVSFTVGESNASEVERLRAARRGNPTDPLGAQVHIGNSVREGDVFPMMITRVWDTDPTEASVVQGQVFLDGNDVLWVTSAQQGDGPYQWHETPRV